MPDVEHTNVENPADTTLDKGSSCQAKCASQHAHHPEAVLKEQFNHLVEKIKTASHEEWPELEKTFLLWARTKEQFESQARPVKEKLCHMKTDADHEVEELCEAGKSYITAHPWKSLAIAGIAGLAIGILLK